MSPASTNVVVLTWKPEINPDFKEADFDELAKRCWKQGFVDVNWRFSGKRYQASDFVIVLRQGLKPGLVALGHVRGDRATDASADGSHYTLVRLTVMRDHFEEPFLTRKDLLALGLRKSSVDTQSSGAILLEDKEVQELKDVLIKQTGKDFSDLCLGVSG